MTSDAALKSRIDANKAKKEKYERVKNSIASHGFSETIDLSHYKDYIKHCKEAIDKIDGNEGYHYLSNFKSKLSTEKATMKTYLDFVRDANSSFKDLYKTLEAKIKALDSAIESDKAAYNKGKNIFQREWEW